MAAVVAMSLASLLGTALPKRVHSIDSPKSAESSKKSISFSANNPDENNAGVNPPPLQPVTSASYNLGIPDLPPEGDSYADEYLEDEFVESPIKIEPGAAKADVLSMSGRTTKEVRAQVARLQAWEEQLQTYSDQLTETGWRSWKRGAVTSVMNELQRKVVPDLWKESVSSAELRVTELEDRNTMAHEKEKALLKRIDELENGPGCARELRAQLEAAELQLSQMQAREKNQSVFKQLLSSGAVSANAGGGAPAIRRRATSVDEAASKSWQPPKRLTSASWPPKDASAEDAAAGGPSASDESFELLQMQLAKAQRDAAETQNEMNAMRNANDERIAALESALDAERKQHRHAKDALESVHVEAGIHEAQEMVQLRLELTAASEELDFLRSRQAKVHEEEHRLQMVAEMSKRLGTNVSKFELEALRSQVSSLTQEAERVQAHNAQLQAEAKRVMTNESAVAGLQGEIAAFQQANDRLESEALKRERFTSQLQESIKQYEGRIELLQRQLVLTHHAHSNKSAALLAKETATQPQQEAPAEPSNRELFLGVPSESRALVADAARGQGPGVGGGATRRKLPLLWELGSPEPVGLGLGARTEDRAPLAPVPPKGLPPPARAPKDPTPSGGGGVGGDPQQKVVGGLVTQRAVTLHDEVASEPITVERMETAQPRIAQPFANDACRALVVKDNTAELAAAAAWKEAEAVQKSELAIRLKKQDDANAQELRVVKASIGSQQLHARVAKLGAIKHYSMLGMMRCLRKWAMLLELDTSYHAALGQAANLFAEDADTLEQALGASQRVTVQALLVEPSMLGELGEMRRRLQTIHKEADDLRTNLRKILTRHGGPTGAQAAATLWLPVEQGGMTLRERARMPPPGAMVYQGVQLPAPGDPHSNSIEAEEIRRAARRASGSLLPEDQPEADTLRLQLKLLRHSWKLARKSLAQQSALVRQLSGQRTNELRQADAQSEVLRRTQAQLHELTIEQETWRQQSERQADVIAAAIAAAAKKHAEHEEEVALLSEKIRQLVEEKTGLEALADSQAGDLQLMSSEMIRLVGLAASSSPQRATTRAA